jgi:hypothetical protein
VISTKSHFCCDQHDSESAEHEAWLRQVTVALLGAVQVLGLPRRRPGGRVPDDGGMADPLARVGRRLHGHAGRRVLGSGPAADAVPGPRAAGTAQGPRRRDAAQFQQNPR